ncbi:MAG TPA: YceI family protein, partial [Chloroflexota bacterium]
TSGQAMFKLVGNATIKGVTKPLAWDVSATFTPQGCQGEATSSFKLSDFGMSPPKAGPVISVEDAGKLDVKFQAARA